MNYKIIQKKQGIPIIKFMPIFGFITIINLLLDFSSKQHRKR